MNDGNYAVVYGNPVDGFTMVGPFDDSQNALDWSDRMLDSAEWWVIKLEDPDTYVTEDFMNWYTKPAREQA
jgi:hypothetical protein